jgi:hypothetical protein
VLILLGQKWRVFRIHWPELPQTYSPSDIVGFTRKTVREG